MPIDPVCLMEVKQDTEFRAEYEGETYYFCSRFCLEKFLKTPEDYLDRHKDFLKGPKS